MFAFDTLKTDGHFLCKYYKGAEEKAFEMKLKRLFAKVHREKPESSRAVCNLKLFVFNADSYRNPERRTLWHCVAKRHRLKRTSSANADLDGAWLFQRYYVYPYLRSESVTYQSSSATWVYDRHCIECREGRLQVYQTLSCIQDA